MKIVYITQWFSAMGGGGEVQFVNMITSMAKRGHNVHVLCQQFSNHNDNYNIDNLYVHRIKPILNGNTIYLKQNMRFMINAIWKGSQIMKDEKIDIIHANNYSPIIVGSLLSRIYGIPLIKTIHAVYCATPHFWKKWSAQDNVSSLLSVLGAPLEKITIRLHADTIHTVSNATKKDIMKLNAKSKIIVVPNGVNLAIYDKLEFNNDYQKLVVFIGRLVVNKNLQVLIYSFKEVIKKISDAKFIVIGSGPMLGEWKKMVSDLGLDLNVEFTGFISEKNKMDILSKCSLLALPSTIEGHPLAPLEAFALSKPVLLSDIEPSYDLVSEGVDGFILPAHDAHKWAEKIIFLLSNRAICEQMGSKGRLKVEKKYSLDSFIENMEAIYISLLKFNK
jgi:glycosyltransferase involved in cell wall biosynthesis